MKRLADKVAIVTGGSRGIGGATVERCYTIASSPTRPCLVTITVKRVAGGLVSNWLHDQLRPGMELRALGPLAGRSRRS